MTGTWVWKSKNRDNKALEKIYEWYCVKQVGTFRRAYAIRPQYKIDPKTKNETNEIECFMVIEYGRCQDDAFKKYKDEKWYGAARYGKALFSNPSLLRVCFSMKDARKIAYARYETVVNEVGDLLPKNKIPVSPMEIG